MSELDPSLPALVGLRCRCGTLRGQVDATPVRGRRAGLHIVCYCADCRAFALALERPDGLDAAGGTAIWQTTPSRVRIQSGTEQLRCLRLSDKGMLRWHTACCNTPVANTMSSPGFPFAGLIRTCLELSDERQAALLGTATGVNGRSAKGQAPAGTEATASLGTILRTIAFLLRGRLAGAQRPTPFFDANGQPVVTPRVLSVAEREAVRERDR
ncbi:MAG: hypothetical protein IV092_06880 [Burkholderiaceae bacterium]|nr:hypothetical protein [Burkholderiaceae bacterium]